jgi:hypothetical protein
MYNAGGAPASTSRPYISSERYMLTNRRIALLVILFAGLLAWRSPILLTEPRFWGEEGRYYYEALQTSRWSVFTLVVRGNFQLITNVGATIATLVPAVWAPAITTYFGFALAASCIYLFGLFARENGWTFFAAILTVAVFALLAQGYEVYLSTVNAQWLCAISLLFLSVLSLNDLSTAKKGVLYVWVGICALSGVPPVVLTPFFFLAARLRRSRSHLYCAMILATGAVIQIIIICLHPQLGRNFHPDFVSLTAPWLLQTVASPLLTAEYTDSLLLHLHAWGSITSYALVFGSLFVVALGSMIYAYKAAPMKSIPLLLASMWICVPTVQVFGALGGNSAGLISGWQGGRYFFLGVFCFVLLLGLVANATRRVYRRIAIAILVWMALVGIYQARHGDWKGFAFSGPSWRASISKCGDTRPCDVQAWPGGPDWAFMLYRR